MKHVKCIRAYCPNYFKVKYWSIQGMIKMMIRHLKRSKGIRGIAYTVRRYFRISCTHASLYLKTDIGWKDFRTGSPFMISIGFSVILWALLLSKLIRPIFYISYNLG